MKSQTVTLFALVISAAALTPQVTAALVFDDFNGVSIDTGLWQTSNPFGDSSITSSGGNAVFTNRGRLLSVSEFPISLDITGRFTITGSVHDQFKILTRTDGVSTNPFGEFDIGINFYFSNQNDIGSTSNNIGIARNGYPGSSPIITSGTFGIDINTAYDFRITDDGTNLALYINNLTTPVLTAVDSTVIGNRIGIYNREGSSGGSSISNGSVIKLDYLHAVPEPSQAIFGAFSIIALFLRRSRESLVD
jgi:hypothetical protein